MQLLKEDTRRFQGQDVVFKDISAVNDLATMHRTCLGPNGLGKLVVTHLGKAVISRRTSTILENLPVEHPAVKLVVMAANNQAQEIGDNTTFVITVAGEILEKVKPFLEMRLSGKDLIEGLDMATKKCLEILPTLSVFTPSDLTNAEQVTMCIKPVIGAKMNGYENVLAPLTAQACCDTLPKDPAQFNVEHVRVAKVMGGSPLDSQVVRGFCLPRDSEGSVKHITNCKIAVFGCAVDKDDGENKGNIVFHNAEELTAYTTGEEEEMKRAIDAIVATGVNVIATGATFGEIAQHFIEQRKLMAIKIPSKFDLRRFCLATGASAMVRLGAPTAEEIGHAQSIDVDEVGGTKVVKISQPAEDCTSRISTILIRAATQNQLDEMERVINDGVNVFKAMTRNAKFVAGGGACEIELSRQLESYGQTIPGLQQYGVRAFAEALAVIPKTLAENAGLNYNDILSNLRAAHAQGKQNFGVDIENGVVADMHEAHVYDLMIGKEWAIKVLTDAVRTVLQIDQIIMSKPAGGPKPPKQGGDDED
nr:T-complex protein 1 subunit theta [Paratrimastix eleionoma]